VAKKTQRRRNSSDAIETFTVGDKTVEIHYDPDPINWRKEGDTFGTILYLKGSRYMLGDEAVTAEEISETAERDDVIALPVYAYIHSGIAMKTTPFGDPWDSGQSGIIFVTVKDALKSFGRKRMTNALRKRVEKSLAAEVEAYGRYLNGEIYGYVITDADGEHIDSLWGIDDYKHAVEEAKSAAKAG
jgi:hypothetical protein